MDLQVLNRTNIVPPLTELKGYRQNKYDHKLLVKKSTEYSD